MARPRLRNRRKRGDGHVLPFEGDELGLGGETLEARRVGESAGDHRAHLAAGRVRARVEEQEVAAPAGNPPAPACCPSWPAPRMPMVMCRGWLAGVGLRQHACVSAPRGRRRAPRGSPGAVAENRGGEQRGVGRAGRADRQRSDRDAGRHLHDGQQRVDAAQRLRLHRHAEHRQRRLGGGHARQVRRAAGAGDQHLEAAAAGRRAYSNSRSGVRCADTTRVSCGTPRRVEHLGGGLAGSPSRR